MTFLRSLIQDGDGSDLAIYLLGMLALIGLARMAGVWS